MIGSDYNNRDKGHPHLKYCLSHELFFKDIQSATFEEKQRVHSPRKTRRFYCEGCLKIIHLPMIFDRIYIWDKEKVYL